ncbi:MAG: hypothetical protein ACQ9MH_14940 [Nitrospinales bacterium]
MNVKIYRPLALNKCCLANTQKQSHFFSTDFFVLLGVLALLCFISVTDQSLWIDESITAWLASHATFKELINTQVNFSGSETQMPLYLWYIWGWAKIFGIGELSLRMSNVPFLLLLLSTILWGGKLLFKTRWAWVIAAVSPFISFYANEARPYVAVMAFSSLATICFLAYLMEPDNSRRLIPWLCLLGIFFASGMCMLSAFLIPVFLTTLFIAYKINPDMWKIFLKNWFWPLLLSLPLFVVLGGWFAWTLLQGFGGMRESPGLLNLSFAAYEFLGFIGLGPPRNLIRSAPTWSTFFQISYIVQVSIGLIGWLILTVTIIIRVRQNGINICIGLMIWMMSAGISLFFLTAFLFHFRFWGRHLAQFYPLFLLIIIGLVGKCSQRYFDLNLHRIALYTLVVIWIFSSVRLVFLTDYKKDDYRSAVSYAQMAAGSGGTILWAANPICGSYYGLYYTNGLMPKVYWPTTFPAIQAMNWDEEQIEHAFKTSPHPIVIAIGKPDLFDRSNALNKAIIKNKVQLIGIPNTFMIYKIP